MKSSTILVVVIFKNANTSLDIIILLIIVPSIAISNKASITKLNILPKLYFPLNKFL